MGTGEIKPDLVQPRGSRAEGVSSWLRVRWEGVGGGTR